MANCLRSFKGYSFIVFFGRRNQHNNFVNQKLLSSVSPLLKKMTRCDYSSPPVLRLRSRNPKVMTNLRSFSQLWKNINSIYHTKNFTNNFEKNVIFKKSRVESSCVFCAKESKAFKMEQKEPNNNPGRPDQKQLDEMSKILSNELPQIFSKTLDYSIYHPNLVFENNIRGTKSVGILAYAAEIFVTKIIAIIRFGYIKVELLKITAHPEDGTIRIRWRVTGITLYRTVTLMLQKKSSVNKEERWYDGFSIFYVKSDGLIHKHTVSKMMPDNEEKVPSLRNDLTAKVAFTIGVTIKSCSF